MAFAHAEVELDPSDPADWITVARRWARGVCRNNEWWDADDLEGYILLDMVRWPVDNVGGLWARARSSTADWHRKRLGRGTAEDPHAKGQMRNSTLSLDEVVTSSGSDMQEITLADLTPSNESVEDEVLASILGDWLPLMFDGRDATILRRVIEGYKLREIAEEMGVTEGRISQILTQRLRPKIERMLKLDKIRQQAWVD